MNVFKKLVILAHRYLGIAISLLVIMWFVSGIVMMYAGGMPRLTPQLRLERLPELDLARVQLTAEAAAERARIERASSNDDGPRPGPGGPRGGAGRVQLLTVMDRPAYRVGRDTVFADTGEVLHGLSLAQSSTVVAKFMNVPENRVHHVATLTSVDQWTLGQARALPLHKFEVDDEDETAVYVQPATGEIATLTTRNTRLLAWMGTIPHWLYFTALRQNQPVWYRTVVWGSGAACALAVLGLILSVTQFKKTRPFDLAKAIPYSGWMRWHYVTGAIFGIFTLTWAFSGLLSMEPFAWTNARGLEVRRDVFTGGAADLSKFPAMDPATWRTVLDGRGIKEVDFVKIQDEHYYVVRQTPEAPAAGQKRERLHQPYYVTGQAEKDRVLIKADTLEVRGQPFSAASLVARLKASLPDVPIVASELLSEYDSYYYSRGRQTPLPVLRVKFADPAETWLYVDPEMSEVLATIHRLNRVERWLYNGLHSLDFAFWYDRRPLWDIGMITLLLGGLASSCLGLVMGIRRMKRGAVRVAASLAGAPPAPQPSGALSTAVSSARRALSMRTWFVLALLMVSGSPTLAADRVADMYTKQVDLVEHDLVSLAQAMPAEKYGFRPSSGAFGDVRTFGEQVKHAATMIFMTAAIVLEERSPHGPGTNDNGPDSVQGKDQIVEYLKGSITYARKAMASLNERNHLDPLKTYFGSQSRIEVAAGVAYHSYNHYGQMVVYARMNGIVPPSSQHQ